MGRAPVLWHIKVSHYNEKARWALDHKNVPHERRTADPGTHPAVAGELTGGRSSTFPVLVLDDWVIGDSTEIIAALEQMHPDPPLYPRDPAARRRALELEDFFDEELGPYTRRLVVHHALAESELAVDMFLPDLEPGVRAAFLENFTELRTGLIDRFGIDEESIELALEKVGVAGERFRSELRPSGHLAGDEFSVADLTLAAMVAPAVAPPEYPYRQPQRGHDAFAPLRAAIEEAGILDWSREIYARHRGRTSEITQG